MTTIKRFFTALLLMLMVFSVNVMMAQQMELSIDEAVRIGKLDCGLTYYIRHNKIGRAHV